MGHPVQNLDDFVDVIYSWLFQKLNGNLISHLKSDSSSFPCRHVYSTRTFMIPVLVFTLLYNVPKFFELYTERVAVDEAGLQLVNVTLAEANQGPYSIEFDLPLSISMKRTWHWLEMIKLFKSC